MTCIVGVVENGTVWIGGDSHCDAGCPRYLRSDDGAKVFARGPFLFGAAGPSRILQLLRYLFDPPFQGDAPDTVQYLMRQFLPALKEAIEQYGGASINNPSDTWSFLLGYQGKLWDICFDLSLTALPRYGAVGCGRAVAVGSLYTTEPLTYEAVDPPYLGAETRLRLALSAAAEHDVHVEPPFTILALAE